MSDPLVAAPVDHEAGTPRTPGDPLVIDLTAYDHTADTSPLHDAVRTAVRARSGERMAACAHVEAASEHDELLALSAIHDLWMAPLELYSDAGRLHGDPGVCSLKRTLEDRFLDAIRQRSFAVRTSLPDGVEGMRRVAALELVPAIYRWLEVEATWDELVDFLAAEGGPDAGFDDLVALAQIGLRDDPKLALAENYWDEMGRGALEAVHTRLHDDMVEATNMPRTPREHQPSAVLARVALGGVLATNRYLQPELLGALGLIELQAGPRCRAVVRAMRRLGAEGEASAFYQEHAVADPRHGREWLHRVVAPLAEDPQWASRMVDGAAWRHEVNHRFFDQMARSRRIPSAG
jgi:hypothetical protein